MLIQRRILFQRPEFVAGLKRSQASLAITGIGLQQGQQLLHLPDSKAEGAARLVWEDELLLPL